MNRFFSTLLASLAFSCVASAQAYFEWTPKARKVYEKVIHLRLREAQNGVEDLKREEPANLIVHHLENYIDFFYLYLQEDRNAFKALKSKRSERLDYIQAGDSESPYYLFVQADIRFQWALLKFKFNDYLDGFQEVSKAYKLLVKNQEMFPDFMPNLKNLSILHALAGTIPDNYKWGVKLFSGLEGSIAEGRREMETVLTYAQTNDFLFEKEMKALYAYLLLHLENKSEEAWSFVQSAGFQPEQNALHCFIMANIGMRGQHNDEVITLLERRPKSRAISHFAHLDFMLGLAKLRRLDVDAKKHFLAYLKHFKGEHYIKEAYQKLAWHALIFEGEEAYWRYLELCREQGTAVSGNDKSAQKEAESGQAPQVDLLKARLLFDGGYYEQALKLLNSLDEEHFPEKNGRLEYFYRKGRIHHGLKQFPQAISHYLQTIRRGENETYFYACNAALQIGLVYEEMNNPVQAKAFFQRCLSMKPDEYRASLHQKAKAGINRLKK